MSSSPILSVDEAGGPPPRRFRFVANPGPLIHGGIGGTAILLVAFAWAWWIGRIRDVDTTYLGVLLASAGVSVVFIVGSIWRNARRAASALGCLEFDQQGVRWNRADASLGFTALWTDIERATVDSSNATVVLFRCDAAPIIIGVLSQHGVPSGFVLPEKFEEIVTLVTGRVPTSPHLGSTDSTAGGRTVRLGALVCVVAGSLFVADTLLEGLFGWGRLIVHMPIFIGAFGVLTVVAGARIRAGKGPLVSPLYTPTYRTTIIRFLVVASLANFVLLVVVNSFAR